MKTLTNEERKAASAQMQYFAKRLKVAKTSMSNAIKEEEDYYLPLEDILPSMIYTFANGNTIVNCTYYDLHFKDGDTAITLYTSAINRAKVGTAVATVSETSYVKDCVRHTSYTEDPKFKKVISDIKNSDFMKGKDLSKLFFIGSSIKAVETYKDLYGAIKDDDSIEIYRNDLFDKIER